MYTTWTPQQKRLFTKLAKNQSFPDALSRGDQESVMQQCINQDALDKAQIKGFAKAYNEARTRALSPSWIKWQTPARLWSFMLKMAAEIEPRNKKGLRTTLVILPGMTVIQPPTAESLFFLISAISDALKGKCCFSPIEAYYEFEEKHPLEDGNGRLGHLLWAMLMSAEQNKWPTHLPPSFEEAKKYVREERYL